MFDNRSGPYGLFVLRIAFGVTLDARGSPKYAALPIVDRLPERQAV